MEVIIMLIIIVVAVIVFRFLFALNQDSYDLQGQTLSHKFQVIVNTLNADAYRGRGHVTSLDKRSFNLYEDGQNQIIHFHYSTGHLTITWKYKYFQKEVIHERQFNDVRNLSLFEQQKIAEVMIKEMTLVIANHKNNVLGEV